MKAVFKHELSNYLHSLTAYVFGAFLLVFTGIGAMFYNIQKAVANFEYVLASVCLVFVVIIPLLTMRVIAEERKQKTDQLLYSLPLSTTDIIMGKYLALLTIYLIPLVIIMFYPLVFSLSGDVYLPASYGSLLAFFLLGAALIAIGTFISSLTENQGLAAGITIPVLLLDYYSVSLANYISSNVTASIAALCITILLLCIIVKVLTKSSMAAYTTGGVLFAVIAIIYFTDKTLFEGLLPGIMTKLSLFERFYTFVNGIFDVTAIIYYMTVIIFFLFLSVQSLEKRRYN